MIDRKELIEWATAHYDGHGPAYCKPYWAEILRILRTPRVVKAYHDFQAGAAWQAARPVQTDFDDRINRLRGKSIWLREQRNEAQELIDDMQRATIAARTSEGLLDPDMPAEELRLHCGEMTEQEIRTARAVIRWANSRRAQPVHVDEAIKAKSEAYWERNRLVAILSRIWPSGRAVTDIPGWDAAWHNCVYIDSPRGQLSWHIHDDEMVQFASLPEYRKEWDGHTTEEKYRRLLLLLLDLDAGRTSQQQQPVSVGEDE